jgi:hypothetical protein
LNCNTYIQIIFNIVKQAITRWSQQRYGFTTLAVFGNCLFYVVKGCEKMRFLDAGKLKWIMGITPDNCVSRDLIDWAVMEKDDIKVQRILDVAQKIEQRYRLAHGLPNMGV